MECTAGCSSQIGGNVRALLIPFPCLGRGYLHIPSPFLTPRRGMLSVGCGPGIVFDSACTQLSNHQVLSISLQKNSVLSFFSTSTAAISVQVPITLAWVSATASEAAFLP